jgi:integrase
MSDEIVVRVHSYGPERALSLVYIDPVSNRKVAKSAKTKDWREAERLAGELEKELRAGRFAPPSRITWGQFVERYTAEKLASLRPSTRRSALESLGKVNGLFHPDKLVKVSAPLLSRFQAELRKAGLKETAIAHHLRHVKAALRWAERQGMLYKAPSIEMPKAIKGTSLARSRAVTGEEFERMLSAAVKVRPKDTLEWQHLLKGVWLSGLRAGEAVSLTWDEGAFSVDLCGRRPAFRIRAEGQKSGRDEVLPMTPDFAEWLLSTYPEAERTGKVFKLLDQRTRLPLGAWQIGRIAGKIGRKAGVVTNKADGKYAGLHDLRRGFCTRWATKVMPAVLRKLARHANIATTLAYYVDLDADAMADELWAKHTATTGNNGAAGNTSGNNGPETPQGAGTHEGT